MRTPLDTLDPIVCEVGYGSLGRSGDLGYEGKAVEVGGRRYGSALSTHAPARLVYEVPRHHGAFRCQVALNGDVPARHSHANFVLLADGRRVAEALRVQAGEAPRSLVADCGGARLLELRVTTSQWANCHAVWLDPSFEDHRSLEPEPAVITDPLRRADITVPELVAVDRAIVTAASPGFEGWVDDLFASIEAYGNVPGTRLVLFALGESPELLEVAARHEAVVVACRPRRALNPTSKAVLYSAARAIPSHQLVCLDADMLVLGDLGPLFAAMDALPPRSVLICGEGNDGGIADLRSALDVAYWGGDDPPFFRRHSALGGHPLVVNDGMFAGTREALLALEEAIGALSGAEAWVDERADVGWRNQFVFNVALSGLGTGRELDPVWNLQLHAQDVEVDGGPGRPRARWRGREVRVLHFSGAGKHKLVEWRKGLRSPGDPLASTGTVDGYETFLASLRPWVGRRGVGTALRWSMFGTADGLSARVRDPGTFPPFALLHHLVLANGCARVLETGTAQGISAGCLAAAVAHRPDAAVVSFDPTPWPEATEFWALLPPDLRRVIEQRPVGGVEGMTAALAAGERYHAAFLDSIHTEEQVYAEFELARQLVVEGGLILAHDPTLPTGTVEGALKRIEADGYGVTRLMTATDGVAEDDGLGLAVIENRRRAPIPAPARPVSVAGPAARAARGPNDLQAVDAALGTEGDRPDLLLERFHCLSDLGRSEEALELGRRVARTAPDALGDQLAWLEGALAPPTVGTTSPARPYGTALSHEVLLDIQQAVHHFRYQGRQLVKSPFDLALYSLLFEDLRPATVFEIGSKSGASAVWFADLMGRLGIDGRVHSFDLFPVTDVVHPAVTFHAGDGRRLGQGLGEDLLDRCARPYLVIEDADHSCETTLAVLDFFHAHLAPGEYVVIEDGNLSDVYPEQYPDHSSGPHRAIRSFLAAHPDDYEIDAALCDFFGYNATTCSNGFLRRTGSAR